GLPSHYADAHHVRRWDGRWGRLGGRPCARCRMSGRRRRAGVARKVASLASLTHLNNAAAPPPGSSGDLENSRANTLHTAAAGKIGGTPSAQAWFAGGERVGYDPQAHAIVAAQGAPLNVFLRRQGDLAHAVSFLPGFPDGSFGWGTVLPHLPNAA